LFALTGAKAVDREVLAELLAMEPDLVAARPGQLLIADKNYYGREFEGGLAALGVRLLRPARKAEPEPAGVGLFKPLRQLIESVNDTFKGQLDLEQHGGHTPGGVWVRVLQRILALTAAIWHNHTTGQPTLRSLVAYDHRPLGINHLGAPTPSRPRARAAAHRPAAPARTGPPAHPAGQWRSHPTVAALVALL
jgi:hypothetical protein